jgi:hypothetical protein
MNDYINAIAGACPICGGNRVMTNPNKLKPHIHSYRSKQPQLSQFG